MRSLLKRIAAAFLTVAIAFDPGVASIRLPAITANPPSPIFNCEALTARAWAAGRPYLRIATLMTHMVRAIGFDSHTTARLGDWQAESNFSPKTRQPVIRRLGQVAYAALLLGGLLFLSTAIYDMTWLEYGHLAGSVALAFAGLAESIRWSLASDVARAGGLIHAATRQDGSATKYRLVVNDRPGRELTSEQVVALMLDTAGNRWNYEGRLMTTVRLAYEEYLHRKNPSEFRVQVQSYFYALVWRIRYLQADGKELREAVEKLVRRTTVAGALVVQVLMPGEEVVHDNYFEDEDIEKNPWDLLKEMYSITTVKEELKRVTKKVTWVILVMALGIGIGYFSPIRQGGDRRAVELTAQTFEHTQGFETLSVNADGSRVVNGQLLAGTKSGRFDLVFDGSHELGERRFVLVIPNLGENMARIRVGNDDRSISNIPTFRTYLKRYRQPNGRVVIPVEIVPQSPASPFRVTFLETVTENINDDRETNVIAFGGFAILWVLFWPLRRLAEWGRRRWDGTGADHRAVADWARIRSNRNLNAKINLINSASVSRVSLTYRIAPTAYNEIPSATTGIDFSTRRPKIFNGVEVMLNPAEGDAQRRYDVAAHEIIETSLLASYMRSNPTAGIAEAEAFARTGVSDWGTHEGMVRHAQDLQISNDAEVEAAFHLLDFGDAIASKMLSRDFAEDLRRVGPSTASLTLRRLQVFHQFVVDHPELNPTLRTVNGRLDAWKVVVPTSRWTTELLSEKERQQIVTWARELIRRWDEDGGGEENSLVPLAPSWPANPQPGSISSSRPLTPRKLFLRAA